MKYLFLFLSFGFFTSSSVNAQDDTACSCCTKDHQAFDFWEGDWNVYDTTGTLIGENLIIKLQDNCILQENWKNPKGYTGTSYNYFDLQDSTWNQLWIDNTGAHLILKGHASDNQMIMESELLPGKKIDFYKNQITWTTHEDGSVTQIWNIISKDDKLLQTVFKGIYRKKLK